MKIKHKKLEPEDDEEAVGQFVISYPKKEKLQDVLNSAAEEMDRIEQTEGEVEWSVLFDSDTEKKFDAIWSRKKGRKTVSRS